MIHALWEVDSPQKIRWREITFDVAGAIEGGRRPGIAANRESLRNVAYGSAVTAIGNGLLFQFSETRSTPAITASGRDWPR